MTARQPSRAKYSVLRLLFFVFSFFLSMLRNNASGPDIGLPGRSLAGLLPGRHHIRPFGRPSAGRRADFGAFPVAVLPKSGRQGGFPARSQYCATESTVHSSTDVPSQGPRGNHMCSQSLFSYTRDPGIPETRMYGFDEILIRF